MLDKLRDAGYEEILFISHASAILSVDFPETLSEIESALLELRIPINELIGSGGGEAKGTQRLRRSLTSRGWNKHVFQIAKTIDGVPRESTSHEVDHVRTIANKGTVALEIEWNNKDPFFDRDLENFKRLHAEGAISAGVIVTRGSSLQAGIYDLVARFAHDNSLNSFEDLARLDIAPTTRQRNEIASKSTRTKDPIPFQEAWVNTFVSDKFGTATTHWGKLRDRIDRGVGNPCPLLLVGLPISVID